MAKVSRWPDLLDTFKHEATQSPELQAARDRFVTAARKAAARPTLRRVYRYEDVGRYRTLLDGRAVPLEEPARTIFALAMSDHNAGQLLASELPMLAAAARLTGEAVWTERVRQELHEIAGWSPLQRPGWSAYAGKVPPDGKDGNWLATGTTMRAIADTLEIMPPDSLPTPTVARLHQLLAGEIISIVDDWAVRRPWFVRGNMPLTNQWVLPTEGLIRACLVLGRERHAVAYEVGIANLLAHLDAHGTQGAFEEGIHYADFTVTSLLSCARAMALGGDRRAIDHPFLRQYPTWAVHHFQPGGFFINAFDAFSAARGNKSMMHEMLASAAIALGSREALWALEHLAGGADNSLPGMLTHILPRPIRKPRGLRTFAAYERAARVNWRSDWTNSATGVWIRGGNEFDSHDHMDRGHVNVILRGKPALIEAGTPAYHNPRLKIDYASGRGHNVLQLGLTPPPQDIPYNTSPAGWQKVRSVAPIHINRLDASGGDIVVDGTAAYDGLKQWHRHVVWDAMQITIEDAVELEPAKEQIMLFRWHLGTTHNPRIVTEGNTSRVTWPGVCLMVMSDTPLHIATEPMPDHTLHYRKWEDTRPDHLHTCLLVTTKLPVTECRITTMVMR